MANQNFHNANANVNVESMDRAELMAYIYSLQAQNRTLNRRLDRMQQQASGMAPGFYMIDHEGHWNGPFSSNGSTDSLADEYPDGATLVEVYEQLPAFDEAEAVPGYTIAGGYAFREAASW